MYITAFLDNVKKFEVKTLPGKREGSIQLEINTFDRITLTITPDQAREIVAVLQKELPYASNEKAHSRQPGDDDIDF